MPQESDFFIEMREWSNRKITLLSDHVTSSTKILKTLYYIDGFAGRGLYADGSAQLTNASVKK